MSKRSQACEITKETKIKVWNRDKGRCVICKRVVAWNFSNAHVIKRSQGGLGIEQNIVTLCPRCHNEEDNGSKYAKMYEEKITEYIKSKYEGWTKEKVTYKKY